MASRARSSNTGTGFNEETQSHGGDIAEDITKAWNLDDAYRYAPKRPDGDPWKVLLDPLLERERIRCEGWKDEVGNLLIFAGLFSAVVTAFLIDSYKTLQPSDNKDIIALLSQIAANQVNINNTLNAAPDANLPPQLPSQSQSQSQLQGQFQLPSQTFQPPPSAIRINTLWFLSLILALTVVLVGIVSLQWLRAYQTYYDLTPSQQQQQQQQPARTALALHHMRTEALRRWHVWKILNALPVLLQIGLVLFLVGVVDFLKTQVGGVRPVVWVSVSVGVCVVLLFMVGTTVAPGVQMGVVPVRIWWRRRRGGGGGGAGGDGDGEGGWGWAPSQCPYKSPQASLVCGIVDLVIRACGFLFGLGWCVGCLGSSRNADDDDDDDMDDGGEKGEPMGGKNRKAKKKNVNVNVMNTYLSALRRTRTWMEFDLVWLRIRDAYVQSVYVGRFGRLGGDGGDGDGGGGGGGGGGGVPMGVDLGIDVPLYDTLALLKGFTRKTNYKSNSNSNANAKTDADAGGDHSQSQQTQTQTQTLSTEVLIAAYHCLAEISRGLTVDRLTQARAGKVQQDLKGEVEVVKERSGYLRFSCDVGFETLEFASGQTSPGSYSHVGTSASASTTSTITLASDTIRLLHDQTLSTFLDHVSSTSSPLSPSLSSPSSSSSPLPLREKNANGDGDVDVNGEARRLFLHRRELGVRIQLYMLAGKRSLVSMTRFGVFPGYLEFLGGVGGEEELVFAHQYIHIVNRIFGYLASNHSNNNNLSNTNGLPISPNTDLHARVEVLVLIEETSRAISRLTARLGARQDVGFDRLGGRVRGMLEGVRGCLERGVTVNDDGMSNGNGKRPEDVLHLLYCAGMVVCGCVGLPEHVGSMTPTPFESAYMGLKGFLKGFRKGVYRDGGAGYGYGYGHATTREEEGEARWDAGVREVERRFREAYPGDGPGEVERGLWDALECTEDVRFRSGGGGAVSYIPFVVFGRIGMPAPRVA